MNTLRPAFIAFLLLLGWTNTSSAQMFSVDDDQDRPTRITTNSLMVGIAPADFTFRGAATPGRVPLEFTGIMYRAVLESPTLVVYSAFNPDIGTGGNITAFNIGASVQNRFMLRGGARSAFYIPFRITTDWRTARNKTEGDDSSEFQQSSVLVGGGVGSMFRLGGKGVLDVSANGNYGYAVRSFGAEGGGTYLLEGKARYLINNLGRNIGLSFGYDFTMQEYFIDGEIFDYRFLAHSFFVGIRF